MYPEIEISFSDSAEVCKWLRIQTGFLQAYDENDYDFVASHKSDCVEKTIILFDTHVFEDGTNYSPMTFVDIGSGIGVVDLFLAKKLNNGSKFILMDGKNDTDFIEGPIYMKNRPTENDSNVTLDGIRTSGLDEKCFEFRDPRENFSWQGIEADVVFSIGSWGLHYPLDEYLTKVDAILKPGGFLFIESYLNIDNAFSKLYALYGQPVFHRAILFDLIMATLPDSEVAKFTEIKKFTQNFRRFFGLLETNFDF